MQIWNYLKMSNSKDNISTKLLHRSQWEMPTSRQEKDLNVIHILGYVILSLKQLSASTCFKTIVRLMHSRAKQALGMNSHKRYGYKLCNQVGFNQAADPFNRNCHSKHEFKTRSDQDHVIVNQKQLICTRAGF